MSTTDILTVLRAVLAALMALAGSATTQQQTLQDTIATLQQTIAAAAPAPAPVPDPAPAPAPAPSVAVTSAAQLQAALDTMPGAVIRLKAGTTYVGHFTLRNNAGTAVTTIVTDGTLPAGRIAPATVLPKICSPDREAAISTAPGAHHYAFVGVEICEVNGGYTSVALGTNEETALAQYPHHITFDRVRIKASATGQQRRAIMAHGANIGITNSAITGIKYIGEDAQAIYGNGPGPYLIDNNELEAAGENILFGGADPKVPNLVPTGLTITRNWIHKATAWRTTAYTVKNLLELKNARQVQIADNVLEYVWVAGQTGYAILLTPRNQEGTCTWCIVEDVTVERNLVRHAAGGVNVLGVDDEAPSLRTNRIRIRQNAFLDIGSAWGGGSYVFMVGSGPTGVTFDHNTVRSSGARGTLTAYGTPAQGFTFTNNVATAEAYGIFGDGTGSGSGAIATYFPGGVLTRNALAGARATDYPAGFGTFPTLSAFNGHFTAADTFALIAGTDWANAGTDGADLGAPSR